MKSFILKLIPDSILSIYRNFRRRKYGEVRLSTSISDNQIYPDFCIKASIDGAVFSNFKRNEIYCLILEHVSEEHGMVYLEEIRKNNNELLEKIEIFKQNDEYGNPRTFEYPKIGHISPSTLRYIKVLGDLTRLFKKLDGLKICEIGIGYGGQCRIINSVSSPSEYTLVDIKPALMLAQRFLDKYILNAVVSYKTMNELSKQEYDLVISNYAFTELPRDIQDVYLKKVILNSKRGYMTYNDISPDYFKSYKKEELLRMIPGSRIIEEKPLTHEKNCIIIWGN